MYSVGLDVYGIVCVFILAMPYLGMWVKEALAGLRLCAGSSELWLLADLMY